MNLFTDVIYPFGVYRPHNISNGYAHGFTPRKEFTGDTTSNEYMPFQSAFHGMSELVVEGGRRALIYKLRLWDHNPMYSKRARGINRDFNILMSVFSSGGKTLFMVGDLGCEAHAGLIVQRIRFDLSPMEFMLPLLMVGVKPEYVFSGNMNNPVQDPDQFILFVNPVLVSDAVYAAFWRKLNASIVTPIIAGGIKTVFTGNIWKEFFNAKSYVPAFKSAGAMVDYKNSFNNAIDLGDTFNVDYRYPEVRHWEIPESVPDLPGVGSQSFQVTLNAEDIGGQMTPAEVEEYLRSTPLQIMDPEPVAERAPAGVWTYEGPVTDVPLRVQSNDSFWDPIVVAPRAVEEPPLEIIGLDDELPPEDRVPPQIPF